MQFKQVANLQNFSLEQKRYIVGVSWYAITYKYIADGFHQRQYSHMKNMSGLLG